MMLPILNFNVYTAEPYSYLREVDFSLSGVEKRLSDLYGASRVFLTNSGMEAIATLIDTLLPSGGVVCVDRDTYYETRQWLYMSRRFQVREVDCGSPDRASFEDSLSGADLLFFDNPSTFGRTFDTARLREIARVRGAKVVVDNTVLSLHYTNPIPRGADYAVESYTKYVCGHGDCMAGGIVCKDPPGEDFVTYIARRGRVVNPMTAYLVARGLETLGVRMEKHTRNALAVTAALKGANCRFWYAGKGGCVILPGRTRAFAEKLKVFKLSPTFGTTYSTCSPVRSADFYNIVGDYVRLFCGLEEEKLLVADVLSALSE